MSNEDITWLLEVFPTYRGRTLRGETLAAYYKAEMLLKSRTKIQKRGCSCEYGDMARQVNDLHHAWNKNHKSVINISNEDTKQDSL